MSAQGLEVIDRTVQATHEWLNQIAAGMGVDDRRRALRIMRATLHAIRDHLSHDAAADFAAQMPLLVRGVYYEGWRPATTPLAGRDAEGFLDRVRAALPSEERDAPDLAEDVGEVFRTLNSHISFGEIARTRASLPEPIRALWAAP